MEVLDTFERFVSSTDSADDVMIVRDDHLQTINRILSVDSNLSSLDGDEMMTGSEVSSSGSPRRSESDSSSVYQTDEVFHSSDHDMSSSGEDDPRDKVKRSKEMTCCHVCEKPKTKHR